MSSVSALSASTQNYLKVIWNLSEWSDDPVTTTAIAERLAVRMSSVSDAMRRLASQGLVEHEPYGAVRLTELGKRHALAMVRRHRLIETFLVETLGYRWDQVHDEAETLEHAVSDFMIERIDELLGSPTRDPHGDPIPSSDGVVALPDAAQLSTLELPLSGRVERISDDDPELLRFFTDKNLRIGSDVVVRSGPEFSDVVSLFVDGAREPIDLGQAALAALWVSTH